MKLTKRIVTLFFAAAIGLACVAASRAQSTGVNFTNFKFFSTKGEFNWDKVIYGDHFEAATLYEMQVAIDFENPGSKPFDVEIKFYRGGVLYRTEPFKNLRESGGFNSGAGGDSGTPGMVQPGAYRAEIWYQGKVVKIAEATVAGSAQSGLKAQLAGKRWILKEIKTDDQDMKEADFDQDHQFALKSDLAQMVPNAIAFRADGTCQTTYVSEYSGDNVVETNLIANCRWSVEGTTVEIIEEVNGDNKIEETRDEVMTLTNASVSSNSLHSAFMIEGSYTGGVRGLTYQAEGGAAQNHADTNSSSAFTRSMNSAVALRAEFAAEPSSRNEIVDTRFAHARPQLRQEGAIKWYNDAKGFGFVTPARKGPEVFLHHTSVPQVFHVHLSDGTRVTYETTEGQKGPQAHDVLLPGKR